ncbi:MAG: DUF4258 domain-containing protein [Nanoarchaeota archaeon]|nr:DUF4258 domain-containing protein [Nanoarchaeota archaeon]
MGIILSEHTKKRMKERSVKMEQIRECLDFPDYRISKGEKVEFFKKFENHTLRLVCVEKNIFIKVVTLMWK